MEIYEPMLSQKGDKAILDRPNLVGYLFEPCFEGIRVLIYKDKKDIAVFNRKKRDIINLYPELLDLPAYIKTKSCILDGVLLVLNKNKIPDPNLLQQRELTKKLLNAKSKSKKFPATVFVFDIIEKDGISLTEEPLKKRKLTLKENVENGTNIMVVPYTLQGKDLWNQVKKEKLKGMIAKEMNSRYMPNKSNWSWLEIANINTTDTVIAGLTPKGKGKENFKDLILAKYSEKTDSFRYVGKINSEESKIGKEIHQHIKTNFKSLISQEIILSNDERTLFEQAIWLKPSLIAKVKFKEKDIQNKLIDPEIYRIVSDKEPKDCKLEN
jgi:ATP-dependent DNA ligase